ncbi:MAG: DUF4277 domain-containing protein, partial [Magnetococcales bacterium]|nr:DUF4277 domain-containing protein [Magnetococcales bacterium]
MSIQVNQVKTLILDHFGLVSAVATDLGIVDMIDARLPTTDRSHATMGQRTLAMILNGLGFLVTVQPYLNSRIKTPQSKT